jgi:glycosyltransferase involved in cell wall biosynthesis
MSKVIVFVTYESPWFPAGGIAAVMGKLPLAVATASGVATVVVTPLHCQSKKMAALGKQAIRDITVHLDNHDEPVSVFHSQADCPWYFLQPSESNDPFFNGKNHPYDVPKQILLRDALFFGAAVMQALPAIATHLGLRSEEIEWNLMTQDWEGATAALAFASQDRCRGRLHLTLHNSYDEYAKEADFSKVRIDPQRCPGDTILDRALGVVEQPVFTVSDQFALDLKQDLLQREVMAPQLQTVLSQCPAVGVDNGPFKILAIEEDLLLRAAAGDFAALRDWKMANRAKALSALAAHNPSDKEPIWGDKNAFRKGDAPWFVMAGRDDPRQKGYDVAVAAVEDYLAENHGKPECPQFLFFPIPGDEGTSGLGFLRKLAEHFPESVLAFPFIWAAGFRAALQGAAYGLMPSMYEPFGMANEFYLDGGCVGIGRATGGDLEQIVPLRAASSYSHAVAIRAVSYHSTSAHPTGILFREEDGIASAFSDWTAINAADYNKSGGSQSRVGERLRLHVFESMRDELRIAIEDGVRIYREQPTLYYRMLAEGVSHIQRTFSWHRAGQEYARKVRSFSSGSTHGIAARKTIERTSLASGNGADRVEWEETRPDGPFLIVAEWNGAQWEFYERTLWQVHWRAVSSSPELVARVEQIRPGIAFQ